MLQNVKTVFSLSSGAYNPHQSVKKLVQNLWNYPCVKFIPFTDAEVKLYANLFSFNGNIDLKEMTNNNPSLLSIVVPSYKAKDLNSIQQRVDGKVSQFLWSVVEKISEINVWVKKTLEEISYYCYMASNQLDIDEVNESEFQTTWIGSENILYLYR